jgi:molecular chaperone GrpE
MCKRATRVDFRAAALDMTGQRHPVPIEGSAVSETPETAAVPPAANDEPAAVDAIAVLETENADLKDKLLRTLAEMENLRRRTEREVSDARTYGVTAFARDMLTVADNLRRTLEHTPPEMRESAKALVEGVELTERDFLKTLEKHGVKKREPVGEKFNPNFDQAMFEVPDDSKPSGTVVQVVQAGYVIGDRVLRPSMVGVSKAAPKPAEAPATH